MSEDIWALALEKLSKEDRRQIAPEGQNQIDVLSDLRSLTEKAKDECIAKRWRFRRPGNGEVIILRDVFGKIVSWVNLFKQIGDNAVQYDPQHAALPWAGIRFVLQVVVSDVVKFAFVVEGVESMARPISRYAIFEDVYLRHLSPATSKLREALLNLYAVILLYLAKAKAFFLQSTPKRIIKGVFVAEEEFQDLLTKMNLKQSEVDHCALIVQTENQNTISESLGALAIDGTDQHAELLRILHTIDGPINRVDTQLHDLEDRLDKSERDKILSWISPQPFIEHHEQTKRSDVPGRGEWLLEDPIYTRWHKDSSCSLLWLHGKVGSGKSTLTAIVIEDAMMRSAAGQNPPPVYFYCSRNAAEPARSSPDAILASIVRQLSDINSGAPLRRSIVEKYERKGRGFESKGLRLEESRDFILEMIGSFRMTTIVIDALDEIDSTSRDALLEALENILQDATGLVKIFVSSRYDQDIVCTLSEYPSLDIVSDKNQRDIERFVQTETERLITKRRLLRHSTHKEELKSLIIDQVSKKADGMFRWAALQLELLCTLKLDADVRTTLGRLPPGLKELYEEIYDKQITRYNAEAGRAAINNILKWLLVARTQLDLSAFRTAVSMNLPVSEELSKERMLDLCHNFIVFDDNLDTFRFAHLSVREFLETRSEFAPIACHTLAAEICLVQLIGSTLTSNARDFLKNEYIFDVSSRPASSLESIVGSFHKYSTLYWTTHCISIGEKDRQNHARFRRLFEFFLFSDQGDPSPLNAWMLSYRHCRYDRDAPYYLRAALDEYPSPLVAPFFLASAFGFCEILRESLLNSQLGGEERKRAWEIAAFGEQDEALKTLLTERGEHDLPPEFVVSLAGIVKDENLPWLLSQAPDTKLTVDLVNSVSSLNRSGGTMGRVDVLFNHFDGSDLSAGILTAAAAALSGSRFQALLDRRKDIELSETMLLRALEGQNYDVIKLLIDRGTFPLSAVVLERAVVSCDNGILRSVLERCNTSISTSAMCAAATKDDTTALELFLDHGGAICHSVLVVAAAKGCASVLQFLLTHLQLISRIMLQSGCRNLRDGKAVMSLLLAEASDALIEEESIELMKQAVVGHGRHKIVKLLINRVPNLIITEDILMAAAWNASHGATNVKLLIEHADSSALTIDVLEVLAETLGSYESTRLLLKYIDPDDPKFTARILEAAARNDIFGDELVKVLVESAPALYATNKIWEAAAANTGCGLEILLLLEKHLGQIDVTEELLIVTAWKGTPRTMDFLLQRSQNVTVTERIIESAFRQSARRWLDVSTSTMVRLLLQQVDDLPFPTANLLESAARYCGFETFKWVWNRCHGSSISSTMIHAAAANSRNQKTLKLLLERMEDFEVSDEVIEAIVTRAHNAVKSLKICIDRGAVLNITHKMLSGAAGRLPSSKALVMFLLEHTDNSLLNDEVFQSAAASGHHDLLITLSRHCGKDEVLPQWTEIARLRDIAARREMSYENPYTILVRDSHYLNTDLDLVKELISKGVPIDLPDGFGSTPLAQAAKGCNELLVRALLDAGANPDSRDRSGRSPLFNAASGGQYGIVVALLEKGVDKDIIDDGGNSLMWTAKRRAHMKVYRLLEGYKGKNRQGDPTTE